MNEQQLLRELNTVSNRYRRLLMLAGLAACWLALGVLGLYLLARFRGQGFAIPGTFVVLIVALPLLLVPLLMVALRRVREPLWVARRLERRYPDLDARLLTALEQKQAEENTTGTLSGRLNYLQQTVVEEALSHAKSHRWSQLVPVSRLRTVGVLHGVLLITFFAVVVALVADVIRRPGTEGFWAGGPATKSAAGSFTIKVEPEDTDIERGTGLIVLARFGDRMPGDVQMLVRNAAGQTQAMPMSRSLDDPVFAGRVQLVQSDLTYAVRYGSEQTRWFKVGVYEHPELQQADAKLDFPTYTGMPQKVVQDTRIVTAVEGTKATLSLRLNKPVQQAVLTPAPPRKSADQAAPPPAPLSPIALSADPSDPTLYTATVDMKQSAAYLLDLKDEAGRASKRPAELALNVTANRVPDLKLEFPAKDVAVSPLEEMTVRAKVWDDFGVRRVGINYSMAGQPPQDVVLAEGVAAKDKKDLAHTVALEKLAAEPDQLLSYYLWVEDAGPDGSVRRTSGDMYFAEVRPFEEIFRQGEQPSSEEQQQQQNQQSSQNAQQAEEAAESQKQIIAATWKIIRRETSKTASEQFAPDAKLLAESQAEVKAKTAEMEETLTDAKSKAYLQSVLKHMDNAIATLSAAAEQSAIDRMPAALSAEQAAYQDLLKLRAREHEVVRSNRQQQRGQQSASSSSSRRQQQLDQLKLDQEENRYEQQRTAQQQQQQQQKEAEQRETRQVLSRLRELAQRQEDLNRQMKEQQSALAEAKEEAKKDEIKRQLARLRDQQQEMLRDTDQLRDRMEQGENQERMADAKQQLDQTREEVRKASEALEQNKVPEASAAGARAGEKLNELKEEFRRNAAGQFGESVGQMRDQARELDKKQQELSQQLAELNGEKPAAKPRQTPSATDDQKPSGAQDGQAGEAGRSPAVASADQPNAQGGTTSPEASPRPRPGLRSEAGDVNREQVAKDLDQQKQKLEELLENMRKTVEEAEASEPILSKQLYDTIRNTRQERTDEAIDAARQLVDRGFVTQAREAGDEATKGVTKLREGVEKAATGVLGDETEALRRARAELDALAQQLNREMGRTSPTQQPGDRGAATRPAAGDERMASGDASRPATRPGEGEQADARGGESGQRAATRPGAQQAAGGTTRPSNQQVAQGETPQLRNGQAGQRRSPQEGQQPGEQGGQQAQGERQDGQPNGEQPGQQAGEQQPGQQAGRQPGQDQPGQGQPGQQAGEQAGRQPGQGQPGQGQPGQQPGQQASEGRSAQAGQQPRNQPGNQPGQQGQPGQNGQPSQGAQAGQPGSRQPGGRQQAAGGLLGGSPAGRGGNANEGAAELREGEAAQAGPMTGEGFREWSDRLRDVEEMVGDPKLRADAARIRDQAKALRAEADRHSVKPNWDIVQQTIGEPLAELRNAITEELLRREGGESLVPIDREPVPPAYAEQVRRYYERLGSGK